MEQQKYRCGTCGRLLAGHPELIVSTETSNPIPIIKYTCNSTLDYVYNFMIEQGLEEIWQREHTKSSAHFAVR